MTSSTKKIIAETKGYTLPALTLGKENYISFYAFDPEFSCLKRKKIMLGRVKGGKKAVRAYAQPIMQRLSDRLSDGWNPWIEQKCPLEYTRFDDVCDKYREYLSKLLHEGNLREQTLASYISYMKIMCEWVASHRHVTYIYQFDRRLVTDFLDYVFIERGNSIQTRNNYLAWLKVFAVFLLQRGYITTDPTAGQPTMKRRSHKKNRDVIPDSVLEMVREYLMERNRHYLLACYLCHYVLVRPYEMSWLRIRDINISAQTLFIHGEHAKNHNDAVVTLPAHVLRLMIDLKLFDSPGDHFIFSRDFKPGAERRSEKVFRDYWHHHLRKDLRLSERYKFYSLKDTGITNMLRCNKDVLTVRDQARHSSIMITNIYTPKDISEASPLLMNYEGVL